MTFESAATVFFDPFLRLEEASRHGETRDAVIGLDAEARWLYVVHVVVEDTAIRIITARRCTREERRRNDS